LGYAPSVYEPTVQFIRDTDEEDYHYKIYNQLKKSEDTGVIKQGFCKHPYHETSDTEKERTE
jgi:hypothetical protein